MIKLMNIKKDSFHSINCSSFALCSYSSKFSSFPFFPNAFYGDKFGPMLLNWLCLCLFSLSYPCSSGLSLILKFDIPPKFFVPFLCNVFSSFISFHSLITSFIHFQYLLSSWINLPFEFSLFCYFYRF